MLMDALVFTFEHRTLCDKHIDVSGIFLQSRNQSFAHVAMLAIVAHVPDALAVSFDEEHVGVIDAVAVKERCYLDVANADAFWIFAW